MIAGCLNQAKRIVEKYDKILYGPAPEILVEETHTALRQLILSDEAQCFLDGARSQDPEVVTECDTFIKKIVEAVSPIIPVALRNKSLDGSYLRTALHFMGAAEVLFAQYEGDIRLQANPAGLVGMSSAMHAEFKRSTIYNEGELRSLRDSMKDMRAQYQTCLGLGNAFPKDTRAKTKRRNRSYRASSLSRGRSYPDRGISRNFLPGGGDGVGPGRGGGRIYQNGDTPIRGRGICYGYQSGNCRRGASCRFLHVDH